MYLSFYESNAFTTRKGYIGYASATTDHLYINNEENADIYFYVGGVQQMVVSQTGNCVQVTSDAATLAEVGTRRRVRSTSSGVLTAASAGRCLAVAAGITINNTVFAAGDELYIYNDSAAGITITAGAGVTMRLAGTTTTGNRTLAARGLAYLWFNSASEVIVGGDGVT